MREMQQYSERVKKQIKESDKVLVDLKQLANVQKVYEKNRIEFLKERQCDLQKVLQSQQPINDKASLHQSSQYMS